MTARQFLTLVVLALAIAVCAALALPLNAAEPECHDYDAVAGSYLAQGIPVVALKPAALKAVSKRFNLTAKRGFIVRPGAVRLGIEVNGCLLPPIILRIDDIPVRYSGLSPFGVMA